MRIQTGADRGTTDGEIHQAGPDQIQALDIAVDKICPADEFLRYGDGCSILQMGAADLYNTVKLLCLSLDRIADSLHLRYQGSQPLGRCDIHRGGEGIV